MLPNFLNAYKIYFSKKEVRIKHQHIEMLMALWKKPYGKPVVIVLLLIVF